MNCDVFRLTGINGNCPAEPACRENCAIFDPTGMTSRKSVAEILLTRQWGKEQKNKFYKRLEKHVVIAEKLAPVVVMQA